MINAACSPPENAPTDQLAADGQLPGTAAPTLDTQGGSALTSSKYLHLMIGTGLGLLTARAGLGFSDRSISGMTAIFFHNSRSDSDETTETQPLAGLQGESGFGSLEMQENDCAARCAL
jgi:hypothetical protein